MDAKANTVYFSYVLRSLKTGRRYVGSTQGVKERLRRHNAGH
ncbi:MAG: GIY-YIG nuclease family protein [Phycisphaerales bacterium]